MSTENEDCICERCGDSYSLRDGCEPTPFCDVCAHEVIDTLRAALAEAKRIIAEATLPYDDSDKAPSGARWEGRIDWILRVVGDHKGYPCPDGRLDDMVAAYKRVVSDKLKIIGNREGLRAQLSAKDEALRKIDARIPKHWNGVGDRKVYHEPSPEDPVGGYTEPYFDEIVDDIEQIVSAALAVGDKGDGKPL